MNIAMIEHIHFANISAPRDKIKWMKMLQRFNPDLHSILVEELKRGNKIIQVRDDTIDDGLMTVSLLDPFKDIYKTNGLMFVSNQDAHDGGDHYWTSGADNHILVAPKE